MKTIYNLALVVALVSGATISTTSSAIPPGRYELTADFNKLSYFYMSPKHPEESLQTAGFLPACSEGICTPHLQVFEAVNERGESARHHPFWEKFSKPLALKVVKHTQYAKDKKLKVEKSYVRVGNGQCVDLVKRFSKWVSASSWIRGNKVSAYWQPQALRGKVIATFSCGAQKTSYCANGKPFDHTAVVLAAEGDGNGPIRAVWVLEQNVSPIANGNIHRDGKYNGGGGSISKRRIVVNPKASKSFNLDNYYVVTYN